MGRAPGPEVRDADVFVSYARANRVQIEPLVAALQSQGAAVWIDTSDIPPGSQWMHEINQAIERSTAVVCLLSPEYVSSEICLQELQFAHECGKRVVPVLVAPLGEAEGDLPGWVRSVNWLICDVDPHQSARRILHTAHTDLDWAREHARLLVRATEWNQNQRRRSRLLKGRDIAAAEASLVASRAPEDPQPVQIQREFVAASRRARSHLVATGAALAAIVAIGAITLSVVAVRQRDAARDAERQAERALNRSNFERFGAASINAPTIREGALAAIASYEAGIAAELPEAQAVAGMLTVAADGARPLTRYIGRADSQQYSGGQQGFALSGDGSTMAYLTLTGELEVVDLWNASTRLSTAAPRARGALTEQVALDFHGERLLYAGVDFERDTGDEPARYTAAVAMYDITTDPPVRLESGTVELAGGIYGLGFGPDAKFVVVSEAGPISVVDAGVEPWQVETVGEEVLFSAADAGTVRFSVDANRVCVTGPISGFYQVQPLRLIAATPGDGCIPEPCAGSAANRIEMSAVAPNSAACIDPEGRVVTDLATCTGVCASSLGDDSGEAAIADVQGDRGILAGHETYAVPGPDGLQHVTIDDVGLVRLFRSGRQGLLQPSTSVELPELSVVPSGQHRGRTRLLSEDGVAVEVGTSGEPVALGRFDIETIPPDILATHWFGDALAVVTGEDADGDPLTDELDHELSIWEIDEAPRMVDVGGFTAYAFLGETAVVAIDDELQVWDLQDARPLYTVDAAADVCAVAVSPSRSALAATTCPDSESAGGLLQTWSIDDGSFELVDEAPLAFPEVSALAVDDAASVAAVAHAVGQIEVRVDGAWIQPAALTTEPEPTNDYRRGWTTVDQTGRWLLTRRHQEGIRLWLIADGTVTEVARLTPTSDPFDPPVDVSFTTQSLSLTWSIGPGTTAGSSTTWDLSAEAALVQLCALLADPDISASSCPASTDTDPPRERVADPPVLTVPERTATEGIRVVDRLDLDGLSPVSVAVVDDGSVWVGGAGVTHLDPRALTTHPVESGGSYYDLVPWGDGVAANGFMSLVAVTAADVATWYLPDTSNPATSRFADGAIAAAGDTLWAFEPDIPALLEISSTGRITEHQLPSEYTDADSAAAASEPDGTVAFVLRVTAGDGFASVAVDVQPDGSLEIFDIGDVNVQQLVVDPAGVVWMYVYAPTASELVRIDPEGTRHAIDLSSLGHLTNLAVSPDGVVWFTIGGSVGSATFDASSATVSTQVWPVEGAEDLWGLAVDPSSGDLWVTDLTGESLIRLARA